MNRFQIWWTPAYISQITHWREHQIFAINVVALVRLNSDFNLIMGFLVCLFVCFFHILIWGFDNWILFWKLGFLTRVCWLIFFFFFKSISWMGIATAEKSWTIGIVGCAEDRENYKFIYNPLSIFFLWRDWDDSYPSLGFQA